MTALFVPFTVAARDRARTLEFMGQALQQASPRNLRALSAPEATEEKTIEEQLADAFNANNAVLTYVRELNCTNLNAIDRAPDWYKDFATQFSKAKSNAMTWENSITPRLTSIPRAIVNYQGLFEAQSSMVVKYAQLLQRNPNDEASRRNLSSTLKALIADMLGHKSNAQNLGKDLASFVNTLSVDDQNLNAGLTKALASIGQGQQQVKELEAAIENLRAEVKKWGIILTASAIAAGVSVIIIPLGLKVAAVSGPVGVIGGIMVVIGIVGAAAGAGLGIAAIVKVQQYRDQVIAKASELTAEQCRVAQLVTLKGSLSKVVELSKKAQETLGLVTKSWDKLQSNIQEVVDDLDRADGKYKVSDFGQLIQEMRMASDDWKILADYAGKMSQIKYYFEEEITPLDKKAA
jgi:hypothetical protein